MTAPDFKRPRVLLRRHGIRPRKRLGQHFLVDTTFLARIIEAADVHADDTVLEVGPGLGVLTDALAEQAGRVVAVELDERMRAVLAETVGAHDNIELVAADILDVDPATLLGLAPPLSGSRRIAGYKVVANLPYYITSAVLRHLLEARAKPERLVVMVQKEVAERITAAPGDMSVLAVAIQLYAVPTLVSTVPARAFYPQPEVDSAVLRLDTHATPPVDIPSTDAFFSVVRAGFSQKRKQLKNSLAGGLGVDKEHALSALEAADIEAHRRAQSLSLDAWAALTRAAEAQGLLGAG